MAKLVANIYGDALFELAREGNRLSELSDEVGAVADILRENGDMARLMNHPSIVKEEKIRIIEEIFAGRASDELVGLMRMIVEKDHYAELEDVFCYFIGKVKEYLHIGTAHVTTAAALSEAQKNATKQRLLETTDYVEFEMEFEVDPDLIGGMVIRIGDRVVDSSIRTKLYNLTRELTKIQLKAGECAP